MTSDINQIRSQLMDLNRMMLSVWQQRKKRVHEIQNLKTAKPLLAEFKHYDPHQEWNLFLGLSRPLKQLSQRELLSLSLLMEDHASAPGLYPEWSRGIHLKSFKSELNQMINPLLIKLIDPKIYTALPLKESFNFLSEFIDS